MEVKTRKSLKSPLAEAIDQLTSEGLQNFPFAEGDEPSWYFKVVQRLQRSYAPDLKPDLLRIDSPSVRGTVCAIEYALMASYLDFEIEEPGILYPERFSVVNPDLWLMRLRAAEQLKGLKKQAAEALDLSFTEASQFFTAFGKALERGAAFESIKRMNDNRTVQICLFLLFQGPEIKAGGYSSVSNLVEAFLKRLRGDLIHRNPAAKSALIAQFRKICSEDGVKLRKRGRPRRTSKAEEGANLTMTPPKKGSRKKPLSSGK